MEAAGEMESVPPTPSPTEFEELPLGQRRLNKPEMYKQVFEQGRSSRCYPFTLRYYFPPEEDERSRVGFILRKKLGKAPTRNLFRRILRRFFQQAFAAFPRKVWIIFDLNPNAGKITKRQVWEKAGEALNNVDWKAHSSLPHRPENSEAPKKARPK